jgi:hypothetical protein
VRQAQANPSFGPDGTSLGRSVSPEAGEVGEEDRWLFQEGRSDVVSMTMKIPVGP